MSRRASLLRLAAGCRLQTRVPNCRLDITSADSRWIGAWWLGFVGCGVAAILNAFPILSFARELPEARRHRAKDVNQAHVGASRKFESTKTKTADDSIASLPTQISVGRRSANEGCSPTTIIACRLYFEIRHSSRRSSSAFSSRLLSTGVYKPIFLLFRL